MEVLYYFSNCQLLLSLSIFSGLMQWLLLSLSWVSAFCYLPILCFQNNKYTDTLSLSTLGDIQSAMVERTQVIDYWLMVFEQSVLHGG